MEISDCEDTTCYMDLVPMEILTFIFQYLSDQERKNCRLVCQRWFAACNVFTPFEKIVGLGIYTAREILDSLTFTLRPYLNLEFHFTNFEDYPISFWIECGSKILSLVFIDCDINNETVANVITYCENLQHLSFKFIKWIPADGKTFCSVDMLDILLRNGLVRKSLTSMEIDLPGLFRNRWVSNDLMERLFFLFPNVTKFEFFCDYLEPGQSNSKFVLPCIYNKLMSSSGMEKLRLHGYQEDALITAPNLRRLKEIKVDFMNASTTKLFDFICMQEQLKTLDCLIRLQKDDISVIMPFLQRVLISCSQLRHLKLKFTGNGTVTIDGRLFRTLITSNLEMLRINCETLTLRGCTNFSDLPANHTLRYLFVETAATEPFDHVLFLEKFRRLKHLTLCLPTDHVLQAIWQYQPNLKSLRLWHCESATNFGFIGFIGRIGDWGESYSIGSLKKLQYLELKAYRSRWEVGELVFCECISHKLRYLCMDLWVAPTTQLTFALNELVRKTSQLEAISLSVKHSKISPSWWLKLCGQSKRLRYICMTQREYIKFTTYEMMFERCSSLRAVMNRSAQGQYVYCDVIRKKLMMKSPLFTFPIMTGRVDSFAVDWLQL